MFKIMRKKRDYNIKNKLYIEAKYLEEAGFGIGQNIIYKINKKKKKIVVSTVDYSNSNTKKVVKTTNRVGVTPVIDIRTKDIREFINSHDNIEVTVYKEKIVFRVNEAIKIKGFGKVIKFKEKIKTYAMNVSNFAKVVNSSQMSVVDAFSIDGTDVLSDESFTDCLKRKTIKMISLFSGAGMMDKGFLDNGNYDIQLACDMSTPVEYDENGKRKRPANDLGSYHIETYKKNIGDHIIDRDILTLTEEDIPTADFVAGGISCVSFSKLNTSLKAFRKKSTTDFPLLDRFLDVVRWSKAKAFLIENVVDFVTVKKGVMIKRIQEVMSDFNITYKVINAKDLGSAQSRKRVFIFGIKGKNPEINLPNVSLVRTVRDAFKDIEGVHQQDLYGETRVGSKAWERMKYVPQGGNLSDVPEHLRPAKKKFNDYCMRLHYDKQSPTITHIGDSVIFHPEENRKISVREGARIFSMPDEFTFVGTITSIYEQLKNGVDYRVSSFLASTIAEQLLPII